MDLTNPKIEDLKRQMIDLKKEVSSVRQKYKISEEKRKSMASKITKMKEECKLHSDNLLNTERNRLLAEYNLLMSKKKIKKLENKLSESKRDSSHAVAEQEIADVACGTEESLGDFGLWKMPSNYSTHELGPDQLHFMREFLTSFHSLRQGSEIQERQYKNESVDSMRQEDLEKLSSKLELLKCLSVESCRKMEDKKSHLEEKKRMVYNVKNEIEKIRRLFNLREISVKS